MKVCIAGGGIGGLTAALALQKKGIDSVLYEAKDTLRAAGAGIWMSSNSIKMMDHLGISRQFLNIGIEMKEIVVEDGSGKIISSISMEDVKKKHVYAIHSVKRQSLHELISGHIESKRIVTGKKIKSVKQNNNNIILQFEDGSADECDVLIGADGIRSTVREEVNPGIPLRYSGQTCWYGLSAMTLPEERKNKTTEIWMGKLRFGFTEVNQGQVYFFAVEKSPSGIQFQGDRSRHLLDMYKSSPSIIKSILSHAKSEDIIKSDLYDIKPFIPLAYGRTVLIGDAGHATTPNLGQGAAQAMEDGVLIAELLSKKSPEAAVKRFEIMRKKRIKHIVKTSWRMGQIAHGENFLTKNIAQSIMRMTPEAINLKMMDRILTPVFP